MVIERDDWRAALDEVDLPEPKPGKKLISFTLPVEDVPAKRKPAKKKLDEPSGLSEAELEKMNAEDYAELASSPRRRAREAALLLLFAADKGSEWALADNILTDVKVTDENRSFALDLARLAYNQRQQSDQLLDRYARDWDVSRFSSVDLAILRLAVAEFYATPDMPDTVVINEAIELAKKFGSEESSAFINGILDNICNKEERKQ